MEYKITAKNTAKGVSEATYGNTLIEFDSSRDRNQNFAGPAEILCAAFAACCLKNVERFSEILKFSYEHAEIEVCAKREEKPPRMVEIHYTLKILTPEDDHKIELLKKNIEQFGTIFNTLKASCPINGEIVRIQD
jgi:uncharacterized OsmC-like protein